MLWKASTLSKRPYETNQVFYMKYSSLNMEMIHIKSLVLYTLNNVYII